ncbi:MAG: DUF1127 domain-containing protein [Hyphomicrobiales bacterium]
MRDYALNHAASFGEGGASSFLSRLLRNWRARRAVGRMDSFDDYMLRDIGVSRGDVRWAAGLPLTVNAALALEERSRQRISGLLRDEAR